MTGLRKIPVVPLRDRGNDGQPFMQAVHEMRVPMIITHPPAEGNPIAFANKAFLHRRGSE